jgi:hypothetical protein
MVITDPRGWRNQDVTATSTAQVAADAGPMTDGKPTEISKELAMPVGSYEDDISD